MRGPVVYLDSSAIVKRYVREPGSDVIRRTYLRAYSGDVVLSCSAWNVGEVLGALDRARRLGRLSEKAYSTARRRFLLEVRRMSRLGAMLVVPVRVRILARAWRLVEEHHIYVADALQVATAEYVRASQFMTGDGRLHDVAAKEGLNSVLLG